MNCLLYQYITWLHNPHKLNTWSFDHCLRWSLELWCLDILPTVDASEIHLPNKWCPMFSVPNTNQSSPNPSVDIPYKTEKKKKNVFARPQHRQHIASSSPTQPNFLQKKTLHPHFDTHQTPAFHIIGQILVGPPQKGNTHPTSNAVRPVHHPHTKATFPENPGPVPHTPNRRHH